MGGIHKNDMSEGLSKRALASRIGFSPLYPLENLCQSVNWTNEKKYPNLYLRWS